MYMTASDLAKDLPLCQTIMVEGLTTNWVAKVNRAVSPCSGAKRNALFFLSLARSQSTERLHRPQTPSKNTMGRSFGKDSVRGSDFIKTIVHAFPRFVVFFHFVHIGETFLIISTLTAFFRLVISPE